MRLSGILFCRASVHTSKMTLAQICRAEKRGVGKRAVKWRGWGRGEMGGRDKCDLQSGCCLPATAQTWQRWRRRRRLGQLLSVYLFTHQHKRNPGFSFPLLLFFNILTFLHAGLCPPPLYLNPGVGRSHNLPLSVHSRALYVSPSVAPM